MHLVNGTLARARQKHENIDLQTSGRIISAILQYLIDCVVIVCAWFVPLKAVEGSSRKVLVNLDLGNCVVKWISLVN